MKSGQALNAMTDTSFGQKSGGRHAEVEAGIRATRPQVREGKREESPRQGKNFQEPEAQAGRRWAQLGVGVGWQGHP